MLKLCKNRYIKNGEYVQQDLFDTTLLGKIEYLERRLSQMTKDINFLKEVAYLKMQRDKTVEAKRVILKQMEMFGT